MHHIRAEKCNLVGPWWHGPPLSCGLWMPFATLMGRATAYQTRLGIFIPLSEGRYVPVLALCCDRLSCGNIPLVPMAYGTNMQIRCCCEWKEVAWSQIHFSEGFTESGEEHSQLRGFRRRTSTAGYWSWLFCSLARPGKYIHSLHVLHCVKPTCNMVCFPRKISAWHLSWSTVYYPPLFLIFTSHFSVPVPFQEVNGFISPTAFGLGLCNGRTEG